MQPCLTKNKQASNPSLNGNIKHQFIKIQKKVDTV